MSEKCKTLILGKGKNFSGDDKIFEQQKQQLKECRKQKFETFKEKFTQGMKGAITGQVDNIKKASKLVGEKLSKKKQN